MKRQQLYMAGAGVALLLAFLWYRRQQAAAAAGAPVDTGGTANQQAASDYATLAGMLQQQQAQEAGDVGTLKDSMTTLGSENQQLTAQIAQIPAGPTGPAGPVGGIDQKTLAGIMAGQKKLQQEITKLQHPAPKLQHGWIAAPFGPKKPAPPKGYTSKGLGNGYWAYVPVAAPPELNGHTNGQNKGKAAADAVAARSHAPKRAAR